MKYLKDYVKRIKDMGGTANPEAMELANKINDLCLISEEMAKLLRKEVECYGFRTDIAQILGSYNRFKRKTSND